MKFIFQIFIFGFHLRFWECISVWYISGQSHPITNQPTTASWGVRCRFRYGGCRAQKPSRHHPAIQVCFRPTRSLGIQVCPKKGTTLQEINISHLGKRKIIFKMDFSGDMLVPRRVPLQSYDLFRWDWNPKKSCSIREGSGFLRIVCLPYI